jgi:hypothetical protein
LNVRTPNPSFPRRKAPNETRAQNGSWGCASIFLVVFGKEGKGKSYVWDDFFLEDGGEWEESHQEDRVELERWGIGGEGQWFGFFGNRWIGGGGFTDATRRPREICCWARVIVVALDGVWFLEESIGELVAPLVKMGFAMGVGIIRDPSALSLLERSRDGVREEPEAAMHVVVLTSSTACDRRDQVHASNNRRKNANLVQIPEENVHARR